MKQVKNAIIGGQNGIELLAKTGDVIIIPAGVGHYSIGNQEKYEVIGDYPDGLD